MKEALILGSICGLLLATPLPLCGQWTVRWSAPDTVAGGLRMPLDLRMVVDSKGRVHALCNDDFDGDWWPEGIRHWVKEDGVWHASTPFVHDSVLCVEDLAAAVDDQDVVHLLWGVTKTSKSLGYSNEVFWSCYHGGRWAPPPHPPSLPLSTSVPGVPAWTTTLRGLVGKGSRGPMEDLLCPPERGTVAAASVRAERLLAGADLPK